jgi:hypothetical protein
LLPDVDRDASSLEGSCAAIVEIAFDDALADAPVLLTEEGRLVGGGEAIAVPLEIFDIWSAEKATGLLDDASRPALCRHISAPDRLKLTHWQLVTDFSKDDLLNRLRSHHMPRPSTWRQLLNLWSYIAPDVTGWRCTDADALRIVPVQGKDVLYAASEVVRLGEKKLLQSDDDWAFLSAYLMVLNQNWTRFLAEQRRDKENKSGKAGKRGKAGAADDDRAQTEAVEAAFAVLEEIGLGEASDVSAVIKLVATGFFSAGEVLISECVQLAQIAAKLGASVDESFRYVSANRRLKPTEPAILFDEDGTLEDLLPESIQQEQFLHADYAARFSSCTREEWLRWVSSGRAQLQKFAPLVQRRKAIEGRSRVATEAKRRGHRANLAFPYVTSSFVIEDWDFPDACWAHWEHLSQTDPRIWAKVAGGILAQRDVWWSRASGARLLQVSTNRSMRSVAYEPLLAEWLLKLRVKACLPDTRDMIQLPADLLCRTPETEALMDIERFVHGALDREATRPLLAMLGVRATAAGPDRLLDRLCALAKSDKAPVHEVEKWYRRLDQLLDSCSTADAQCIKDAFRKEKLILAHDGTWTSADSIFLASDDSDVPDAAVIRPSVLDLSLWHRVGVADRPSADLALQWLRTLSSGRALAADDARRVRTLLARYPTRIWVECGHWMNLLGEWVTTDTLFFALSMQSLFRWSHLHDWVKRGTADFQRLQTEIVQTHPFASLPALLERVEERFSQPPLSQQELARRAWLCSFGSELERIELVDLIETARVRALAASMATTAWVEAPRLDVIPYLDGIPAGTARLVDVLWLDGKLFVSPLSKARLARRVPEELGANLNADIRAALVYAFERSPEEIQAYLEENFTLGEALAKLAPMADAMPKAPSEEDEAEVEQDVIAVESDTAPSDDAFAAAEPEYNLHLGSAQDDETENESFDAALSLPGAVHRPRAAPRPRSNLMMRFALTQGFRQDGDGRFFHVDGSWINRTHESSFPWERHSATGEVLLRYDPRNHCLEREPLQIEADTWGLLEQRPDLYSFIFVDAEGEPVEMTGGRLRALRESGDIVVHPATYRIVYGLET